LKRVLLDQGCPHTAAQLLNAQGWDVVHVSDVGMSRADDVDILDWARKNQRVCVTLDADFHTHLALQEASAPSTIRIRIEGLKADAFAKLLLREWPRIEEFLDKGAVVTITEKSTRLRALPIR
jgi:predicted nuclease of predicted toxin-antitoxin system